MGGKKPLADRNIAAVEQVPGVEGVELLLLFDPLLLLDFCVSLLAAVIGCADTQYFGVAEPDPLWLRLSVLVIRGD